LDHIAVLYPDIDTPFTDTVDVVHRLLPYHVFQHPQEDLDKLRGAQKDNDGETGKVIHDERRKEIAGAYRLFWLQPVVYILAETKFALDCHKRRKSLQERFRRARIREGKVGIYKNKLNIYLLRIDGIWFSVLHLTTRHTHLLKLS
jgi:hypothetical protein